MFQQGIPKRGHQSVMDRKHLCGESLMHQRCAAVYNNPACGTASIQCMHHTESDRHTQQTAIAVAVAPPVAAALTGSQSFAVNTTSGGLSSRQ
jgi:hypothetical protein